MRLFLIDFWDRPFGDPIFFYFNCGPAEPARAPPQKFLSKNTLDPIDISISVCYTLLVKK